MSHLKSDLIGRTVFHMFIYLSDTESHCKISYLYSVHHYFRVLVNFVQRLKKEKIK